MLSSLQIEQLTSPEIRGLVAEGWTTVIVPLGSTEQHGPALPLLVDSEHGLQTAVRAARLLGKTLVGPVVTLGVSPEHAGFPGTVSLSAATMRNLLADIAESHSRSGFRLVYFWIAHGGNFAALQATLPELRYRWPGCRVEGLTDLVSYIAATWDKVPIQLGVPLSVSGSHAGEFEASMMLAARPELVRREDAEAGDPRLLAEILDQMMSQGIGSVSPNGVLGDQRQANAQRGSLYLDKLAEYLAAEVDRHRSELKG
jgi:creatinine amidohydrolase/Fe(II)-dependent formamide hydrolase-like protein